MTNEEFIAQNLCNDCNDKETCSVSCYWFDHMKRLAELKDEQFTKQKQALIDNACEWLAKNYQNLDYINMEGDLFDLSMVEDFRKAMEETNSFDMNTDLQKRIEEAAEEYAIKHKAKYLPEDCYSSEHKEGFLAGTELGYKEAIKVAKEWLKGHIGDFHPDMDDLYLVSDKDEIYFDGDELITDFETDMNKLWDEKK